MDNVQFLPNTWILLEIGDFASVKGGKRLPKGTSYSDKKTSFPYIRVSDFYNGSIKTSNLRYISKEVYESIKRYTISSSDVYISIAGTIGLSGTVLPELDGANLTENAAKITLYAGINPQYISKVLSSHFIQKQIHQQTIATTQPKLALFRIQKLKIPLPPLNEQRRIVTKIEELNAHTRRVREALEEVPQLIEQFRQSVLAAAFRGDLTADWRKNNPDVEPASELLERIRIERRKKWEETELEKMRAKDKEPKNDKWKNRYKDAQEYEIKQLSEIPETWSWISLDNCTFWITDGEHSTPPRETEGIYLLSARNILNGGLSFEKVDFISEETHQKLEQRLKIEAGDVLLSCSGTVGRSCVVPKNLRFSLVRSVAILKPVLEMGEYMSLGLRSPILKSQINKKKTQTAQSNLFQGRIKILALPLAPIEEQQEIIRLVSKIFDSIDSIEKEYCKAKELNQVLNQSILAKAFRGELVPQDPEDEPTSVLLERIRKEQKQNKLAQKRKRKKQNNTPTIPGLEAP